MNAETTVLDVREAVVIHPGDTIVLRVDRDITSQQASDFRAAVLERLDGRVADVLIVCADGLYVIREATP